MIGTWPAKLPQMPRDFSGKGICGLLDDQEQINPRRSRTYPEKETTFSFRMSLAQLKIFRAWYDDDINGGCVMFTAPWLSPAGFGFHRARFAEQSYTAEPLGGLFWKISMEIEIITGVPMAEGRPAIWLPGEGEIPPECVQLPQLSGQQVPGGVLHCSTGTWNNSPTEFLYQWFRNDGPIEGEETEDLGVTSADPGKRIACRVTAYNDACGVSVMSNEIKIPYPARAIIIDILGAQDGGAFAGFASLVVKNDDEIIIQLKN